MKTIAEVNGMDRAAFVALTGAVFEHSPWVAERAWERRPFASLDELHQRMAEVVRDAGEDKQLELIREHPDLVGRMAKAGTLTRESTAEQTVAGLADLSEEETAAFERYNAAYRERFGFPFVICARENKKAAILAAFPERLTHAANVEREQAILEIRKIARLRLLDLIVET